MVKQAMDSVSPRKPSSSDDDIESSRGSVEDVQNSVFLSIAEIEHHEHERNDTNFLRKTAGNLFSEGAGEIQEARTDPIIEGFLNEFSISSNRTRDWIIALLYIVKPKRGTWSENILQIVRKLIRGRLEDQNASWDLKSLPKTPYDLVPMARKYAAKETAQEKNRRVAGWSSKMSNKELPSVLNETPNFFVLSKPPNWTCPGKDSGLKELRGMYEKTSTKYRWFEDKLPTTTQLQTSGSPESLILWAMNELRYPALYDLGVTQFGLCHRLDCQTSGPIIVAKTKDAWRKIVRQFCCVSQFQERKLAKMYLVLVHGKMEEKQGMIKKSIKVKKKSATHVSVIAADGQPSFTLYWVLAELTQKESGEVFSLCLIRILTGRSHQIRVHMQSIGHSVVCDPKYGNFRHMDQTSRFCPRLFLHSYYLAFTDPDTDKPQQVYCPLHSDLRDALRTLSDHPITASLIETGLITDESVATAKTLIKPFLPRQIHHDLTRILRERACEKPLSLTKLRKMYEMLTDCDFDTELYGSPDLASLLKQHFPDKRVVIMDVPHDVKEDEAKKEDKSKPLTNGHDRVVKNGENAGTKNGQSGGKDVDDGNTEIPLEEKSWLFGKHKDHLEDEHMVVMYKSEDMLREPLRILAERREQLAMAVIAHEVKAYLAEHDEIGEGISGRIIVEYLSDKCEELVSLISKWTGGIGVLGYVRKTDGVEEIIEDRRAPLAEDNLFRLGPSTITSEQTKILDNLRTDLQEALSYRSPSDWHKIIAPRPFPPIHGKHGGSLETVIISCLGDAPPLELSELRERVRAAIDSFDLLFGNLKKRIPQSRSVTPSSAKRVKTAELVRRPGFRAKSRSVHETRDKHPKYGTSGGADTSARKIQASRAEDVPSKPRVLLQRRGLSRVPARAGVGAPNNSAGVRISANSSALFRHSVPRTQPPAGTAWKDIMRPKMRSVCNRVNVRSNVCSRPNMRSVVRSTVKPRTHKSR